MSETIAQRIASGDRLYVSCNSTLCSNQMKPVDLHDLGERLGMQHSALTPDIAHYFACQECKSAGRPPSGVSFTRVPDYAGIAARKL